MSSTLLGFAMTDQHGDATCAICALHANAPRLALDEVWRNDRWLLRHHPQPAPLTGWCLLDVRRHCSGPVDFDETEAREWGVVVQRASTLVRDISGCDRVYAIAFGEGARHLHLHLIPRCVDDQRTTAWSVADLYRNVESGRAAAASVERVKEWLFRARLMAASKLD